MYIRIEGLDFGFVKEGIHEIKPTDIEISDIEYNYFLESQGIGKTYRLKEIINANHGLMGCVEEFFPDPVILPKTEVEILQEELLDSKLAMEALVEQVQQDKLDIQLAMAELIETIMGGESV